MVNTAGKSTRSAHPRSVHPERISLDANATSRLRPVVRDVLEDFLTSDEVRNPSSVHAQGRRARALLNQARKQVLSAAHGGGVSERSLKGRRLLFTSGGTESCNTIVYGFLGPLPLLGRAAGHIVSSALEHPAIIEPLILLRECGWSVDLVRPARNGFIDIDSVLGCVRDDTALVTIMAANNETGALQPVVECARALRQRGYRGVITSDCSQILGKSFIGAESLFESGMNAIALSGHKVGAPAGIGAVVMNEDAEICFPFSPLLRGGPQETFFRGGTENLLGAVSFGAVCRIVEDTLGEDIARRRVLRERLWSAIEDIEGAERITPIEDQGEERVLSNTLLVRIAGCRGDDVVVALDLEGIGASTGAACASGKQGASHVLAALGYEETEAREAVRFSIDWDTTEESIDRAGSTIRSIVMKMRGLREPGRNSGCPVRSSERSPKRSADERNIG